MQKATKSPGRREQALVEIFGLEPGEAVELLEQGRARAQQLTSFYRTGQHCETRVFDARAHPLIEHLWRITFADGRLDLYEDHYVRKIAHLLYVPNTQSMLARNRARS